MNCFSVVYDRTRLPEIISFLGDGFKWTNERRLHFSALVRRNSVDVPFAAVDTVNGVITQAILLIEQRCKVFSKTDLFLNLSSWYAVPEHRGIEAILFIRNLLRSCCSCTFTNYTPTKKAATVLKAFGFEAMKVVKYQLGFSSNLRTMFRLSHVNNYLSHSQGKSLYEVGSLHAASGAGAYVSSFFWVTTTKKGVFTARVLNLFIGDVRLFKKVNFLEIIVLMWRHRVISLNFFLSSNTLNGKDCYGPWLAKGPNWQNRVIPPTGSELTVLASLI